MTDLLPDRRMIARQALFDVGLQLAGVRLQVFAERLFAAADASPDASIDHLVGETLEGLEGGALVLVAEEPALAGYRLEDEPASSVSEAADRVLRRFAERLLTARRQQ